MASSRFSRFTTYFWKVSRWVSRNRRGFKAITYNSLENRTCLPPPRKKRKRRSSSPLYHSKYPNTLAHRRCSSSEEESHAKQRDEIEQSSNSSGPVDDIIEPAQSPKSPVRARGRGTTPLATDAEPEDDGQCDGSDTVEECGDSITTANSEVTQLKSEPPCLAISIRDLVHDNENRKDPFERLPIGVRFEILTHLDYPSIISLSQVSRFLHQVIQPQMMSSLASKFAFVVGAEKFFKRHFPTQNPEGPGNFACYICLRVRNPADFNEDQLPTVYVDDRGRIFRERDGSSGRKSARPVAPRRFCIECGVLHGFYLPGDRLVTKLRQELCVWDNFTDTECSSCGLACCVRPMGNHG
jgi:hypothetical protein